MDHKKPGLVLAILALLAPIGSCGVGAALLPVVAANESEGGLFSGIVRMVESAGAFGTLSLASGALLAPVLAVLLFLVARGVRIPPVLAIGLAVVPWLVGLAGLFLGTTTAAQAIAHVNPLDRATIAAAGYSEASCARLLGAWTTWPALCGAALGLALAALNLSEGDRHPRGLVLGLLGLPIVAIAPFAAPAMGNHALLLVLPGLLLVLVAALAGMSSRAPEKGASALAACAVVAAAIAVGAMVTVLLQLGLVTGFGAVAHVSSADKMTIIAITASEQIRARPLLYTACALTLLPVGALLAQRRTAIVAAGAALAMGVLVLGIDAGVTRASVAKLESNPASPPPGVELARFEGVADYENPAGVLFKDELRFAGGPAVAVGDAAALGAELKKAIEAQLDGEKALKRRAFGRNGPVRSVSASFHLERGATLDSVGRLLRAAQQAGYTRVALVGHAIERENEAEVAQVASAIPLASLMLSRLTAVEIHFPKPPAPGESAEAEAGAEHWFAVHEGDELVLRPLQGPPGAERRIPRKADYAQLLKLGRQWNAEDRQIPVHIVSSRQTDLAQLLEDLAALETLRAKVVLHFDAPAQPAPAQ